MPDDSPHETFKCVHMVDIPTKPFQIFPKPTPEEAQKRQILLDAFFHRWCQLPPHSSALDLMIGKVSDKGVPIRAEYPIVWRSRARPTARLVLANGSVITFMSLADSSKLRGCE